MVIVGSGFGGLFAAKFLRRAPVDVTLIDRTNHHLFQPLLYQVATGILSPGDIAPATRDVLRKHDNVSVVLGEVTGFDLDARDVAATGADGRALSLPYDSLVVAAGVGQSYFGHDEFAQSAPGMKTLDDALAQHERIFGAFEMAELEDDPALRKEWLTFVVVGGGPTGVEISGQIAELSRRALKHNYKRFDPEVDVKVLLFDGGDEILASFGDRLSGKATKELERTGVEINCHSVVTHVDADGVVVKSPDGAERRIATKTVIWAAGVSASPLARMLADASGAECDRAGRVCVLPDCSLPGHPEVFVVGDMMALDGLPGCRRGRDAVGHPRRADDQEARRGQCRLQALQVPRPRQHGRRLATPRDRQLPRDPRRGLPRLAHVARRPSHVHDRIQEPLHRPLPVGVQLRRSRPGGARASE